MGRGDREVYMYVGGHLKSALEATLQERKEADPMSPETMSSICRRALAIGLPKVRESWDMAPWPTSTEEPCQRTSD